MCSWWPWESADMKWLPVTCLGRSVHRRLKVLLNFWRGPSLNSSRTANLSWLQLNSCIIGGLQRYSCSAEAHALVQNWRWGDANFTQVDCKNARHYDKQHGEIIRTKYCLTLLCAGVDPAFTEERGPMIGLGFGYCLGPQKGAGAGPCMWCTCKAPVSHSIFGKGNLTQSL